MVIWLILVFFRYFTKICAKNMCFKNMCGKDTVLHKFWSNLSVAIVDFCLTAPIKWVLSSICYKNNCFVYFFNYQNLKLSTVSLICWQISKVFSLFIYEHFHQEITLFGEESLLSCRNLFFEICYKMTYSAHCCESWEILKFFYKPKTQNINDLRFGKNFFSCDFIAHSIITKMTQMCTNSLLICCKIWKNLLFVFVPKSFTVGRKLKTRSFFSLKFWLTVNCHYVYKL